MFKFLPAIPWWLGFPVAIGTGVVLGLVNGVLVTLFRLPAIIVTLGTLNLYRGLTFIISDARQIDRQFIPGPLKAMSQNSPTYAVPWILIIALGGDPADLLVRQPHPRRPAGLRHWLEPDRRAAARHSGDAITLMVFAISGALRRARRHHVREPLGLR